MGKEKKEIGKLLELLNEYSKNIGYFNEEDLQGQTKAWILSKEFGWIGWLVENDKIDFEGMSGHGKIVSYLTDEKDYKWNDIKEGVLLMLLSISDTPIDFLCEILK